MKLSDISKWVGVNGVPLKARMRELGYGHINLADEIDMTMAGKLYKLVPKGKTITVHYNEKRNFTVDFVGPWNLHEWARLYKMVQREIMVNHKKFIREVEKGKVTEAEQQREETDRQEKERSEEKLRVEAQELLNDPKVRVLVEQQVAESLQSGDQEQSGDTLLDKSEGTDLDITEEQDHARRNETAGSARRDETAGTGEITTNSGGLDSDLAPVSAGANGTNE